MRFRSRALAVLLAAGALSCIAAGGAAAADPVLPLSQVTAGMTGEARTVVRGTEITTFPVSIIDVQSSFDGPGGSIILARGEGPLMQQTGGIAEGMSGSPVYVTGADGVPRVIGAVAYGTGDQDNVIMGITPIEQMIDSSGGRRAMELAPAAPRTRAARPVVRVADRAAALRREARDPDRIALYPLGRWTLAGATARAAGPLRSELARSGIQLTSIGPRTIRPPVDMVPGASMSVLLAGGDLVLGALGTVTYVDGATVLGFGHPFLSAGASRFLLGDGYVYQVIPAPIAGASYKLGEPGTLRGMVTGDRADGMTATLGPVQGVDVVSSATDTGRGTHSTVRATLAPDERLLPLLAGLAQDEPAIRVRDGIAGGTVTLTVRLTSPALPRPITYRNVYAAAGDAISQSSGAVTSLMSVLTDNPLVSLPVTRIEMDQVIERRVRAARIVRARVTPARVRPGRMATLRLTLQPWRADATTVRVRFRVPSGLGRGRVALRVLPKGRDGFFAAPADLTQQLGGEDAALTRARLARFARQAQRTLGPRPTKVMTAFARTFDDRNDAVRLLAPGEDADDPTAGVTVPVPAVIYGGRANAAVRVGR
ncbi:MAG: SpoIVB peptidase S55 domain-containing protein [Thermoleophilia bacterium]